MQISELCSLCNESFLSLQKHFWQEGKAALVHI